MSPVRAADRGRYPADWPQISVAIRFGRAGGQCECAGECGTGHPGRCEARHGQAHPVTGSLVVLTTAHRDHLPEHCGPANLFAACQRCTPGPPDTTRQAAPLTCRLATRVPSTAPGRAASDVL